jgi:hypothetical protein
MKDKKALRLLAMMIGQTGREAKREKILGASHKDALLSIMELRQRIRALECQLDDEDDERLRAHYKPSEEERLHGHNTGTGAEK